MNQNINHYQIGGWPYHTYDWYRPPCPDQPAGYYCNRGHFHPYFTTHVWYENATAPGNNINTSGIQWSTTDCTGDCYNDATECTGDTEVTN